MAEVFGSQPLTLGTAVAGPWNFTSTTTTTGQFTSTTTTTTTGQFADDAEHTRFVSDRAGGV